MDDGNNPISGRLWIIAFVFACLGCVIPIRLYWLQIHQHENLIHKLRLRLTDSYYSLTKRGKILDRNGEILSQDIPSYQLTFKMSDIGLASGIVQEIEFCLSPYKRKFRPLRELGILAPSVDDLKQKIKEIDARLRRENLVIDIAHTCKLDEREIARALRRCLMNILTRKFYIHQTQPTDLYISNNSILEMSKYPVRFSGVSYIDSAIRQYPAGEIASQLVGYLGKLSATNYKILRRKGFYHVGDSVRPIVLNEVERYSLPWVKNYLVGVAGTELIFNNTLRGQLGRVTQKKTITREKKIVDEFIPEDGRDCRLSIDLDLQIHAREALAGRKGAIVLMDIDQGDILVSVSLPSYDPNLLTPPGSGQYFKDINQIEGVFLNKVVGATYPFGSVYKIVTAVAALEEGITTPTSTYTCHQVHPVTKFSCLGYHGPIDVETAIMKSCNIYFYDAALTMDIVKLYNWSLQFGLGKVTGSGFSFEKRGVVPNPIYKREKARDVWRKGDTCNSAIGQGYQLGTPLQAAMICALVAREEPVARPRYWMHQSRRTTKLQIQTQTRETIRRSMWKVVNQRGGTSFAHRSRKIIYAGKTGTADIVNVDETHPNYIPPHAWFAGFAPYHNPKVAIAVIVENGGHGGVVASPIAKDILEAWVAKYLRFTQKKKAKQEI